MINLGFQAGFSLYLQIWMCLDCSCSAYLKVMVTCAVLLWEMRSDCLSSSQPYKRLAPCYSWCISFSASLWKKKNQQTCAMLLFQNCTYFFHLLNIFSHSIQFIRLEHGEISCAGCRQPPLQLFSFDRAEKWSIQLKFTSILKNNSGVHLGCSTLELPLSQWDSSYPWRTGIMLGGGLFDKPRGALGWVDKALTFWSRTAGILLHLSNFSFSKYFFSALLRNSSLHGECVCVWQGRGEAQMRIQQCPCRVRRALWLPPALLWTCHCRLLIINIINCNDKWL